MTRGVCEVPIRFFCPRCGRRIVAPKLPGEKVRCPQCHTPYHVSMFLDALADPTWKTSPPPVRTATSACENDLDEMADDDDVEPCASDTGPLVTTGFMASAVT